MQPAQAALDIPSSCEQCSHFTLKSLRVGCYARQTSVPRTLCPGSDSARCGLKWHSPVRGIWCLSASLKFPLTIGLWWEVWWLRCFIRHCLKIQAVTSAMREGLSKSKWARQLLLTFPYTETCYSEGKYFILTQSSQQSGLGSWEAESGLSWTPTEHDSTGHRRCSVPAILSL